MPRTKLQRSRYRQGQSDADALAVAELTRIAVRHGANERRGSAGPTIAKLRENVGAPCPMNRAIYTIVALLRQNGEARAFAAALAAALAPDVQISGTEIELEIAETRLHGSIAAFESEDLAGLISTPDRGELIRECYRECALVNEIAHAEEQILYRRLAS